MSTKVKKASENQASPEQSHDVIGVDVKSVVSAPDQLVMQQTPANLVKDTEAVVKIRVCRIQKKLETQSRVGINQDTVDQYANDMKDGAEFPPVELFQGDNPAHLYLIGDGYHRVLAAEQAGLEEIAAVVRKGTQRDAILHSIKANNHGLQRTNEDKKKSVSILLRDGEWCLFSSVVIAKLCGVSHTFVDKMRKDESPSSAILQPLQVGIKRIGKDGIERRLPQKSDAAPATRKVESTKESVAQPPTETAMPEPIVAEAVEPMRAPSDEIVTPKVTASTSPSLTEENSLFDEILSTAKRLNELVETAKEKCGDRIMHDPQRWVYMNELLDTLRSSFGSDSETEHNKIISFLKCHDEPKSIREIKAAFAGIIRDSVINMRVEYMLKYGKKLVRTGKGGAADPFRYASKCKSHDAGDSNSRKDDDSTSKLDVLSSAVTSSESSNVAAPTEETATETATLF
jgi:hypothetical protein